MMCILWSHPAQNVVIVAEFYLFSLESAVMIWTAKLKEGMYRNLIHNYFSVSSQHVPCGATADIAWKCLSTLLSRLRVYPSWIVIASPRLGDAASDGILLFVCLTKTEQWTSLKVSKRNRNQLIGAIQIHRKIKTFYQNLLGIEKC